MNVPLIDVIRSVRTGLDALTGHAGGHLPPDVIQRIESLAHALSDGEAAIHDVAKSGATVDLADLTEAAAILGMKGKDRRGNAERRLRQGTKGDGGTTTYPVMRSKKGDWLYDGMQSPLADIDDQPRRRPTQVEYPPTGDRGHTVPASGQPRLLR